MLALHNFIFAQSNLQLSPPGLSFLDTLVSFMQKFLNFTTGPYAIFVLAVAGTVVVALLALKPKEGVMEPAMRYTAVLLAVFAIPAVIGTIRNLF